MFMSERIGREYDAVISGVTSFGLFAELPNTIEGFIPIESLFGAYTFDEQKLRLNGTERSYTIGEEIRVKVIDVDFYRRRTEFRLLEKIEKRG
jgi:ribonuclease R